MTRHQWLQSVIDYIVLVDQDRRQHIEYLARMAPGYQPINVYLGLADLCWIGERG